MDDTTLAGRAASGDEAAFELIVRRHADRVWRLARSVLSDDFAAEDAVQETFLKAHRSLGAFRGDAALSTWLLSICHRTCLDRVRRREAEVVPIERLRDRRSTDTQPDLSVAIEQALPTLSNEERRAFQLVDVLGFSRAEAADIEQVPASTLRSRLARARERLVNALQDDDMEHGT